MYKYLFFTFLALTGCSSGSPANPPMGEPYSIAFIPKAAGNSITYTYDSRISEDVQLHSISSNSPSLRAEGLSICAAPGASGEAEFTCSVGERLYTICSPADRTAMHETDGISFTISPEKEVREGMRLVHISWDAEPQGRERVADVNPRCSCHGHGTLSLRKKITRNKRHTETHLIPAKETITTYIRLRNRATVHTIPFSAGAPDTPVILLIPGMKQERAERKALAELPIPH